MSVNDISALHWITQLRPDGKVLLLGRNSEGEYLFPDLEKAVKASKLLEPDVIDQVLSSKEGETKCSCRAGFNLARCQHKFTFADIRRFRGHWLTSSTAVQDTVHRLQVLSNSSTRACYALGETPVCRGFFRKALGLSKSQVDEISARIRNVNPSTPVRAPRTPKHSLRRKPLHVCLAFWEFFFGGQAQTSGDGKRYFPCNLSAFFLYHFVFWPWWKEHCGDWPDEVSDLPPNADPDLTRARAAAQVPSLSTDEAEAFFTSLLDSADNDEEECKEEKAPDPSNLSDDLQELLEDPVGDMLEDLTWEYEATLASKELQREAGLPSFATFMRARYAPEFKDVKKREKHFHCR